MLFGRASEKPKIFSADTEPVYLRGCAPSRSSYTNRLLRRTKERKRVWDFVTQLKAGWGEWEAMLERGEQNLSSIGDSVVPTWGLATSQNGNARPLARRGWASSARLRITFTRIHLILLLPCRASFLRSFISVVLASLVCRYDKLYVRIAPYTEDRGVSAKLKEL